jgi:hypothetical protein
MSKRKREKEENEEVNDDQRVPKRVPRVISTPLIHEVNCLSWEDLKLDPKKQSVLAILNGPKSTRDSFVLACSRFKSFLALRKEKTIDLTFNESLLLEFVDDFLWVLADSNGKCLLDLGSFFPSISYVKKYFLL